MIIRLLKINLLPPKSISWTGTFSGEIRLATFPSYNKKHCTKTNVETLLKHFRQSDCSFNFSNFDYTIWVIYSRENSFRFSSSNSVFYNNVRSQFSWKSKRRGNTSYRNNCFLHEIIFSYSLPRTKVQIVYFPLMENIPAIVHVYLL